MKKKIGILGGGQLGRMLIQSAQRYFVDLLVMDSNEQSPCADVTPNFILGDINNFEDVVKFGQGLDIITIEIERVNTKALKHLQGLGVKVIPDPSIIELIQDKSKQKEFYKQNGIPTSEFLVVSGIGEIKQNENYIPCVNKLSVGGYDGKGVHIIKTKKDIEEAFDQHGIVEKMVDIEKEISVIVSRNEKGEVRTYPPVEMVFNQSANLVDYLISPSEITKIQQDSLNKVCYDIVKKLDFVGILAVEFFLDKEGNILVNEIAPRPHNSGHQTIEGNFTSQYEQLIRILIGFPLGNTDIVIPSVMVNLLGEKNNYGDVLLEGLEEILRVDGLNFHFYGKETTSPFRKMGHITIIGKDIQELKGKVETVKSKIKVLGKDKNR